MAIASRTTVRWRRPQRRRSAAAIYTNIRLCLSNGHQLLVTCSTLKYKRHAKLISIIYFENSAKNAKATDLNWPPPTTEQRVQKQQTRKNIVRRTNRHTYTHAEIKWSSNCATVNTSVVRILDSLSLARTLNVAACRPQHSRNFFAQRTSAQRVHACVWVLLLVLVVENACVRTWVCQHLYFAFCLEKELKATINEAAAKQLGVYMSDGIVV